MLEPPIAVPVDVVSSAEDMLRPNQFPPPGIPSPLGAGKLVQALPVHGTAAAVTSLSPHPAELNAQMTAMEHSPAAPTIADVSLKPAAARQAGYPNSDLAPR